MTFGVVLSDEPLLAEMIALAFESAGHDCLVFKDVAHATRVLHAIRLESIVLDLQKPGLGGLDWLETVVAAWPDLPSRTLLLANSTLTNDQAVRIAKLGAEVVQAPSSLVGVQRVVMERLAKARSGATIVPRGGTVRTPAAESVN